MFELNEPIVRQIIFAMENQKVRYVCDCSRGALVRADRVDPAERPSLPIEPTARYQDIPEWSSADGFQVMEQFAGTLRNSAVRARLEEVLLAGRGTFRRFKDELSTSPALKEEFRRFKHRAMHDAVVSWFNTLRELQGLDILELGHDEEPEGLILGDVDIARLRHVPSTLISELDRQGIAEATNDFPDPVARHLVRRRRARLPDPGDARSTVYGAHTPMGDLCGFLRLVDDILDDGGRLATIEAVYVLSDFRGLGVASALIGTAVADLSREPSTHITASLVGQCGYLESHMYRLGFQQSLTAGVRILSD